MSPRKPAKTAKTAMPAKAKQTRAKPAKKTRSVAKVRSGRMMHGVPAAVLRALENPQRFFMPAAAALGAGVLATSGVILRQELARLLRSAAEGAVSRASAAADSATFRAILANAGLARKSPLASFLRGNAAWIGLAAGLAGAGAATFFLAPKARRLVRDRAHVNGAAVEPLKTAASNVHAAS